MLGRLVLLGFKLNEFDIVRFESSDGIVAHGLKFSSISYKEFLCSMDSYIPILIHRWQLPAIYTTTTKNDLSKSPKEAQTKCEQAILQVLAME